jgi:alpha-galactosidase
MPPLSRRQQVLDLARPEAYDHILERLDALLTEYAIGYLKWDHNRDLIDAGHGARNEPGVHGQTLAVYRLLDELRRRHPTVEIESCAGGGGRVDLGILQRTDRVWASDCIDPLERQQIQRWTQLLIPPELVGSHIGAARSHTTGRTHDLSFRAGTALFCHFGIEWDISRATAQERAELKRWVELYKELRPLLHTGRVVRADTVDPALEVHGVIAPDGREAVFAIVATGTSLVSPPGRVRLPGLDPHLDYRVDPLPIGDQIGGLNHLPAPWLRDAGITLPGRVLVEVGVQAPAQNPEQLILLRLTAP